MLAWHTAVLIMMCAVRRLLNDCSTSAALGGKCVGGARVVLYVVAALISEFALVGLICGGPKGSESGSHQRRCLSKSVIETTRALSALMK